MTVRQALWALYYFGWLVVLVVLIWVVTPQNSPKLVFEAVGVTAVSARVYLQYRRVRTLRARRAEALNMSGRQAP